MKRRQSWLGKGLHELHAMQLGAHIYEAVEPHLYPDDHVWDQLVPNYDAWHALIDAHEFPAWIQRLDRRVTSFPDTVSGELIRQMVPADWFTIMVSRAFVEPSWAANDLPVTDLLIYGYQREYLYRHDPSKVPSGLLKPYAHSINVRAAFYEIPKELFL